MNAPAYGEFLTAISLAHSLTAKKSGSGWSASCPAHDDKTPSLSISEGDDGRALVYCHAGCSQDEVIDALRNLGLWPERKEANGRKPRQTTTPRNSRMAPDGSEDRPYDRREPDRPLKHTCARRVGPANSSILEFPYLTADGKHLVSVVVKVGPDGKKIDDRFAVTRDPKGVTKPRGGYPLYRLPSILANSDKPILVCEGEKTADAGQHLFGDRYEVTTPIGGIGKADGTDWSPLHGRDVVIWPDADEDKGKGHKHAQDVARFASSAGARDVRVVDIGRYGLPDGWDVADQAPDGFDVEQALSDSVSFSLPYTSNRKQKRSGGAWLTMAELLEAGDDNQAWLVDDMLPCGGLSILNSKPKAGKSTLGRCLALDIARGEPWLQRPVLPGPVLCWQLEEKRSAVRSHFLAMGAHGDDAVVSRFGPAPDDAMDALAAEIENLRPVLVIIDPLFRFVSIKDGNDYAEVTRAMEPLLTLARESEAGTHILFLHHARKAGGELGDETLGSSALFGAVDTLLNLKRGAGGERTLSTVQRYGADLPETILVLDPETMRVTATGTKAEAAIRDAKQKVQELLQEKREPAKVAAIVESLEIGRPKVVKALTELVTEGRVARTGTGKRGNPHMYAMAG